MAKSIQDLCFFMKELSDLTGKKLSIDIQADKSFMVWDLMDGMEDPNCVVSSEEIEDGIDINDLCYYDAGSIAKIISDNDSVRNIKVEDL